MTLWPDPEQTLWPSYVDISETPEAPAVPSNSAEAILKAVFSVIPSASTVVGARSRKASLRRRRVEANPGGDDALAVPCFASNIQHM